MALVYKSSHLPVWTGKYLRIVFHIGETLRIKYPVKHATNPQKNVLVLILPERLSLQEGLA